MAISDNLPDVSGLLARVSEQYVGADRDDSLEPGDLSRMSIEALLRKAEGTPRSLESSGTLRFTGLGVVGHSANLDDIGDLSSAWQKAVTATGAALEGVKSSRGRVPDSVSLRTQLVVTASPLPGSVVLKVAPKQSPLEESEPGGQTTAEELARRPLADRASERLVEFLSASAGLESGGGDEIARQLRELGPRVSGAVGALAQVIDKTNVTLDVSWREPARRTRRVEVTPSSAKFMAQVIEGRGLDSEPVTLVGVLETISSRQRWALAVSDDLVQFDASELSGEDLRAWNVGDRVEVTLAVALRRRGDGRVQRKYTAQQIRPSTSPDSPSPDFDEV